MCYDKILVNVAAYVIYSTYLCILSNMHGMNFEKNIFRNAPKMWQQQQHLG
jgi:hypothetical protein